MRQLELFELVVLGNQAFVVRRSDGRLVGSLTRMEAATLKMIAEGGTPSDVRNALQEVMYSNPDVVVDRVEMRFSSLLRSSRGIATPVSFDQLQCVEPPDGTAALRELPGPRVLHWHVTRYCPRKCVYCYAEPLHGSSAQDATISRGELNRIFAEAAILGAEHLVVAGAEPLLREDLPEVMGDAVALGITPFLTTKHPINEDIARRLAAAGVNHVSLSLDTASPERNLMMIGSRNYPSHVRSSMTHLSKAGVRFSIQAVATAFNCEDLWEVARLAADSGAKVMQVVPFETVRKPITNWDNSSISLQDGDNLRQIVEKLAKVYPSVNFELFEKLGTGGRSQFHCDIGMTKLFFLPNGVIHRCYKLVDDGFLTGKDLRECSVAEAWHDPGFSTKISPPRDLYSRSTCANCSRFDRCHSEGRCIYQASVSYGSYYERDRACDGPHPPAFPPQFVPVTALNGPSSN